MHGFEYYNYKQISQMPTLPTNFAHDQKRPEDDKSELGKMILKKSSSAVGSNDPSFEPEDPAALKYLINRHPGSRAIIGRRTNRMWSRSLVLPLATMSLPKCTRSTKRCQIAKPKKILGQETSMYQLNHARARQMI